ncbi:sulfate/thiosulfate import ATP-binding protein CysA [Oxobacter pfennigii]|uniref:Sulfate/thiosulfate import ATP-binding protein CysA n=1 Tax=Oxobacter pfennigii TaxID=36849 RepID=A0A0P9ACU7_9CLOT|nr:ATP-binding cassette domain-containing protein [Oxobacter pfennigii]KPU42913.1 sulfate/thiosulfate import ATP-binding protein CysA [Oxobacter pfennigii]
MSSVSIELRNFALKKGDFHLGGISLEIQKREIFALLGKTGSGKTLLLESIAGYYKNFEGDILLNGTSVLHTPLEERKLGFVYQDYGLFPHMTIGQNIAYGLKMRKKNHKVISEEVSRLAGLLSISHILSQYPGTVSGGERQRTALARALILSPDILLLDEPFSALDTVTKQSLYRELIKIHGEFKCTIIFVTHDFNEAQLLADRVGIIDKGRLMAVRHKDALFDLYEDDEVNFFLGLKEL